MKRTLILQIEINGDRPELCGARCPLLIDDLVTYCAAFDAELGYAGSDKYQRTQQCLEAAYRTEATSDE